MRIGILSDTHNRLSRTHSAVAQLQNLGAEALFHCGDLTSPEIVAACAVLPCYFVFGNNDADDVSALRQAMSATGAVCLEWGRAVALGGRRIAMTHGHMRNAVRQLLADRPDFLLSGHSHIAGEWLEGNTRRINPGALHRAARFTVALLELETGGVQFLPVAK